VKHNAVIFDLDGTLLDTLEDLADSGNDALASCGLPTHDVNAYRYFVGDGVGKLVERMLPEDRRDEQTVAQVTEAYRDEYSRRWNAKTWPYPGIADLLNALTDREVRMAVFSNKPDAMTQKCVTELLSPWRFDPCVGQRNDYPRKPDPAGAITIAARWNLPLSSIVYVGDTATDMETAVAAGMVAVGVLWGFRDERELRESGAAVVIKHPMELLSLLEDGVPR